MFENAGETGEYAALQRSTVGKRSDFPKSAKKIGFISFFFKDLEWLKSNVKW